MSPIFSTIFTVAVFGSVSPVTDSAGGHLFATGRPSALQVSDCPEDETPVSGPSVREGM